jgi:hypothetical protein
MPRTKVIIIGCSKVKKGKRDKASDLYDGTLWRTFRKNNKGKYRVFALSAKYGLIPADKKISTYDSLLGRDVSEEALQKKVEKQLKKYRLGTPYVFTSKKYAEVLKDSGLKIRFVKGGIGEKASKLKRLL